ncbi:MAG: hypothetical protein SVZ03_07550 [Spirochaetota bacterium]|nr:hypothetical protein [Spirochaetota bacterium]
MIREDYIQELEDSLLETIEKKDPKIARRFVLALVERQERDSKNILHSIELLTQQMASMQREMDKRFESLQREMDKRFESMDKRFDAMDKRIGLLMWFVGIIFVAMSAFMAIARFMG